jgi:hypothetical protein
MKKIIHKPSRLNREADDKEREEREQSDGKLYIITIIGLSILAAVILTIAFKH